MVMLMLATIVQLHKVAVDHRLQVIDHLGDGMRSKAGSQQKAHVHLHMRSALIRIEQVAIEQCDDAQIPLRGDEV